MLASPRFKFPIHLLTGILLGIAFPSYPFIRLEALAWVGFVPLLYSVRSKPSFGKFYLDVASAILVWVLISVWWVVLSTPAGALMYFAQTFFLSVPFIIFFFIRKSFGEPAALWSLPFVWTAWEWIYLDLQVSFGWLTLGNSQSNLFWLVQYVDLFGVWAVSFWVMLFNVLIYFAITDWQRQLPLAPSTIRGAGAEGGDGGIRKKGEFYQLIKRVGLISAAMLLLPVLYSIYCFTLRPTANGKVITVSLIQSNIDPWLKWSSDNQQNILATHLQMTDSAIAAAKPDIVIWPETAIPYFILDPSETGSRDLFMLKLSQWQAPVLTGFPHREFYPDSSKRTPSSKFARGYGLYYDSFNSSMLATVDSPQIYHKMKLVPFAERVPYLSELPFLSQLTLDVGGVTSWGIGLEPVNFAFVSKAGDRVKVCGTICYEQLYPGFTAEFVRKGANFLSVITNDAWFGKTYGPYQFAAFARLRSIETRRAMARCANTGLSFFIDAYGRTYGGVPWWEPRIITGQVELSDEQTFYVQHIDLFPKICLAVSLLIMLASAVQLIRLQLQPSASPAVKPKQPKEKISAQKV
ncbi:MAG: apolipoprotein N-acyltransferase [Rhizobacter sp.]|nr:apolipoprotein N-acyltransferase [Chlorobiales bacterium]